MLLAGCFGSSGSVPKPTIGGTVTGLEGSGLVLQTGRGDELAIDSDGPFVFPRSLRHGDSYIVTVATQPGDPAQACSVDNASGRMGSSNVQNVLVTCRMLYAVGGTVNGLEGAGLVLRNNSGEELAVEANGDFAFNTPVVDGEPYAVSVLSQPDDPAQTCELSGATGTVAGSEVTNVNVSCQLHLSLIAAMDIMQLHLHWSGADTVDVLGSTQADCDWDNYSLCENGRMWPSQSGSVLVLKALEEDFDPQETWSFIVRSGGERSNQSSTRASYPQISQQVHAIAFDQVQAAAVNNERIYLGGNFQSVGPGATGSVIITLGGEGYLTGPGDIDGEVYAATPDGEGGWYIGGSFTRAEGLERHNLARLRADGRVDLQWAPAVNGPVYTLALHGDRVYAGGDFDAASGQPRLNLAAFDARTGVLDVNWLGGADGKVAALEIYNERLYVGGEFSGVTQHVDPGLMVPRDNLAAFEAQSGDVYGRWQPKVDGPVYALAGSGGRVIVGGNFWHISEGFSSLVSFDADDGEHDPEWGEPLKIPEYICSGWLCGYFYNPGTVHDLVISNDRVYVGGLFEEAGSSVRSNLAAFELNNGDLLDWSPEASGGPAGSAVMALVAEGGSIYAGGYFRMLGDESRVFLGAVDAITGEVDAEWPMGGASRPVRTLSVGHRGIHVGGAFTAAMSHQRSGLVAFDRQTGVLDSQWNPGVTGVNKSVQSLIATQDKVYVGGEFSQADGEQREHLAAFDAVTGELDPVWAPGTNGVVRALLESGGRIVAGGRFTEVNGEPREFLAAIDATTGALVPAWAPNVNYTVSALLESGGRIVAGGRFTEANGEPRERLAAFDTETGTLDPDWIPEVTNPSSYGSPYVASLLESGGRIVAGGRFTEVNGEPRERLAAFDSVTGGLDPEWTPGATSTVNALLAYDGRIFVGGGFSMVNGEPRERLAAFDSVTGYLDPEWVPGVTSTVNTLLEFDGRILAGGSFTEVNGKPRGRFAVFDAHTGELVW